MTIPEWLPCWSDATQYPSESSTPSRFAWEFLRRNAEYQEDYEREWGRLTAEERKSAWIYTPQKLADETEDELMARLARAADPETSSIEFSKQTPPGWLGNKWGTSDGMPIGSVHDGLAPHISCPLLVETISESDINLYRYNQPILSFDLSNSPVYSRGGLDYSLWSSHQTADLIRKAHPDWPEIVDHRRYSAEDVKQQTATRRSVEFDLLLPLNIQLERIKKAMKLEQNALIQAGYDVMKTAPQPKKLIEYLRVLDAKLTGTKNMKIAQLLFPRLPNEYPDFRGNEAVIYAFERGRYFRDGGYRWLPLARWKRAGSNPSQSS